MTQQERIETKHRLITSYYGVEIPDTLIMQELTLDQREELYTHILKYMDGAREDLQ